MLDSIKIKVNALVEKKDAVLNLLTNMETQTDNLEQVAMVKEAVKKQLDQLYVKWSKFNYFRWY